MDLCGSGLETDPENHQVLGDLITRTEQGEAVGLCRVTDKLHPETTLDLEWLKKPAQDNIGVPLAGDPWSKLKISDDVDCFQSPLKKRGSGDKFAMMSPVSTLAPCWSPQAVCAPSLKTRRAELGAFL